MLSRTSTMLSRRTLRPCTISPLTRALRPALTLPPRALSTTPQSPIKPTPSLTDTATNFPHPIYTPEQLSSIQIAHRDAKDWSDYLALGAVRLLRWSFDTVTGYSHSRTSIFQMTERKWLTRVIFLESIAGVPGMVAAMARHLHSLRLLHSDKGWISTLLSESQNERMHLLIFLTLHPAPTKLLRGMLLMAQGVFTNMFFIAYLFSPRTCHRFVGYLEEEAVITYTRALKDLKEGRLEEWAKKRAPEVARGYYGLQEGAGMRR